MQERAKEFEEESKDWNRKLEAARILVIALEEKVASLDDRRNLWASAFAPIRRLPVEVLSFIFILACSGDTSLQIRVGARESETPPTLPSQLTCHILSHVCKHWRAVASETRNLWQHCVGFHDICHSHLRPQGLLRKQELCTVEELYGQNLTCVHFDFSNASYPKTADVLSTVAQHQKQYVSLRLVGTGEIIGLSSPNPRRRRRERHEVASSDDEGIWEEFDMPRLEELFISITSHTEGHSVYFRAPKLKKLTLLESALPRISVPNLHLPWSQLTHLTLGRQHTADFQYAALELVLSFRQFIDALPSSLTHLRLIALDIADPPTGALPRQIMLFSLRVLEIHHPGRDHSRREWYGLRILRHITAPSLKTFDIIFTGRCVQANEAEYVGSSCAQITSFLSRSHHLDEIRVAFCPPRWLSNVKAVRQHRVMQFLGSVGFMAEVHNKVDTGSPWNLSFTKLGDFQDAPPRSWAMQYTGVVSVDQFIDRFLKRHDPCFGADPSTLERVEKVKRLPVSENGSICTALRILETVLRSLLVPQGGVVDGNRELYFVY